MKDISKWLIDAGLRVVAPRLAVGVLAALIGLMADAGLLGGALSDALLLALRQSGW